MPARSSQYPGHGEKVLLFRSRQLPWDTDYRRRMTVYGAVLFATTCLIAGGVWLVTAISEIPAHVDCNFSKSRPCHNYPDNPSRVIILPR